MAVVKKEVEKTVCDICGSDANGIWSSTEYLNGELFAEMSCPLDLCAAHMKVFAKNFSHYAVERYDEVLKNDIDVLISVMTKMEQGED